MIFVFNISLDIILKNENIETVHVGDQYDFTGTLIAVANKSVMSTPSARTESTRQKRSDTDEPAKNMFLFFACSISGTSSRVRNYIKIILSIIYFFIFVNLLCYFLVCWY